MKRIKLLLMGLLFAGYIHPEALLQLGSALQTLTIKKPHKKGFYPEYLADFTSIGREFRAGVMPYYEENGEKYVLLGREIHSKKKSWDLFAGGSDKSKINPSDQEHPLDAATREFYEEACISKTLYWDRSKVKDYIQKNTTQVLARYNRDVMSSRPAVVYVVKFSKVDILTIMKGLKDCFSDKKLTHCFKEKDALVVVKLKDLIDGIKNNKKSLTLDKNLPYWSLKHDKQDVISLSSMLFTFLRACYAPQARFGNYTQYHYVQDVVDDTKYAFYAQERV